MSVFQITTWNACFGIETDKDCLVIATAPIGKRFMGRSIEGVIREVQRKGWKINERTSGAGSTGRQAKTQSRPTGTQPAKEIQERKIT
jgi:hypothetical protein